MTARSDPEGASEPLESTPRVLRWAGRIWRVISDTTATCIRYRVTGLAAEAAFFGVLSLPPLIFGLAGAIGFVTSTLDIRTIAGFREQLLDLSARILTPDVVTSVIEPTIDDVLSRGHAAVISIGFLLALWSGSRALNVFIDTTTIMYGMAGSRGIVRTRALSFVLYVVFLIAGIVLLPLILAGPTLVDRVLPLSLVTIGNLYWPVVLLGSVCMLATLYHRSVPARTRWRAANFPFNGRKKASPWAGRPSRRSAHRSHVGGRQCFAALCAQQVRRKYDDLRPASRSDRFSPLALRDFHRGPDRCSLERRTRRGLSPPLRHRAQ